MIDVEKFKRIKLSDYIEDEHIKESDDFEYSTLKGYCQHIGYYIVCFQSRTNPDENVAMSFDDVLQFIELEEATNKILNDIGLELKLGQTYTDIRKYLGQEYSTDDLLTDIIRYHYFIQDYQEVFVSLGIHKQMGLCAVEIVTHPDIIRGVKYDGWRS